MEISEHIAEFKRKIIASGNDPKTADTYGNSIVLLMVYYEKKYESPLRITFRDMEDYIIHLVDEKYSPSYVNSFIASAKRFFDINGQPNKCSKLQYRDNPIQSPNVLTYDECMKMCEAPIYLKHQLIINILYYGGLRRSELINLKIENISSDGKLTIVRSKFGESRVIPIPKHVMEMARRYFIKFRPRVYLLNGEGGREKYSAGSIKNIIKNTARTCGIQKRTYPHLMRSSRATVLLDNGATMGYVSWFLGHKKIETTHAYYHKLTIKSMQEQFEDIDDKMAGRRSMHNPSTRQEVSASASMAKEKIVAASLDKIYNISFKGKTYLLRSRNGRIVDAPEGAKWSIGVTSEKALAWFKKKDATISEHISA